MGGRDPPTGVGTAGKASESRASDIVRRRTSPRMDQLEVAVSDTKEVALTGAQRRS